MGSMGLIGLQMDLKGSRAFRNFGGHGSGSNLQFVKGRGLHSLGFT